MFCKVIAIMGPTASGKSQLALQLAQEFKGEIISGDSAQVYIGPDIGTAKPTFQEQNLVAHHLIDIRQLNDPFSLADFQKIASSLIEEISYRQRVPFVVGGTGLYLRGLLEGYTLVETKPDPKLRESLSNRELPDLLQELQERDPVAYDQVDRCNKRRVVRALEIIIQTGRPLSEASKREKPPFEVLKIAPYWERDVLYQRIDLRLEEMFRSGWLEEVSSLYEQGWEDNLRYLRILGYSELLNVVKGELSLNEAKEQIRLSTHRFAKRQLTWLKREPNLNYIPAGDGLYDQARSKIKKFLEA
ncbi:tRNA (adenosine(37)-N6)-dimethylallyltransferase MiaA [bacterium]|nr:tRNA (adenosine(37)-N6)-dimethylallyltransferase MiaA [bacterium]